MKRIILCGSMLAAISANLARSAQPPQAPVRTGAEACAAPAEGATFKQTRVTSAAIVPAAKELPAYCEVQGVIRPAAGSEVGVVYRLPETGTRRRWHLAAAAGWAM